MQQLLKEGSSSKVMASGKIFPQICLIILVIWNVSTKTSVFASQNSIRDPFLDNKTEELAPNDIFLNSLRKEKLYEQKREISASSENSSDGRLRFSFRNLSTSEREKSYNGQNQKTAASRGGILEEQSLANGTLFPTRERFSANFDEKFLTLESKLKKDKPSTTESVYNSEQNFHLPIQSTQSKNNYLQNERMKRSLNFEKEPMRKTARMTAAVQSCDVEESPGCIAWQPELKSWSEAHQSCRQLGGFLFDRAAVELLRNNSSISVDRRSWLGNDSNGSMMVTFFDFLLKSMGVEPGSNTSIMWTGLTRHRGHYQWMTRVPSVEAVVDWAGEEEFPERLSNGCPALSVGEEGTFRLTPCAARLPFACVLQPPQRGSMTQIRNELITGELELRVSSNSSVQSWMEVTTEQFFELELNCDFINARSEEAIDPQETEIFWRKDDVYLGVDSTSIHPADIHDPTKSGFIPLNISLDLLVPIKQGTFSCEVWSPMTNDTFKSNGILVTLTEWETFIITVAKVKGTLRPAGILNILEDVYRHDFPYMNNMTKDLIGIKIDSFETDTTRATYKFHLYLKDPDRSALEYRMHGLNSQLHKSFGNDSSIKLATACLRENHVSAFNNIIVWPFGRAGPIYPERAQCQGKNGEPIPGMCTPNFTNGAKLIPPPLGNCERFDVCPRGYVNVNTDFCVSVTESTSWATGFEKAYVTGRENDILEFTDNSEHIADLYSLFGDVLFTKTVHTSSWVSLRRLYKYGPLVSQKSGMYNFSSARNISWAERHPLNHKECAGFDFTSQKLFSAACDETFPFITVVNIKDLENLITPNANAISLGLARTSYQRCVKNGVGGLVPTYDTGTFVCVFGVAGTPNTWEQAHERCKKLGAVLPQPFLGFLNWFYKQVLFDLETEALYMNLGNSANGVMIDDPKVEYYNWIPGTDFKKEYGVLKRDGWTLTNSSDNDVQKFICEERSAKIEHEKFELAINAQNSILVDTQSMRSMKPDTIKCFRNGNLTSDLGYASRGLRIINGTQLGYYKCFAWSANPTRFFQSNTVLLSNYTFGSVFSIKMHYPGSEYKPLVDDRTFWSFRSETDIFHTALLEELEVKFSLSNASVNSNFFTVDESENGKYEYVHLTFNHGLQRKSGDESYWLQRLRAMRIGNEYWTIEEIRSTTGCEENLFHDTISGLNLTFQKTFGSGEYLAEELCVDDEGAPVSRTCHGDFLEGYFWSETLSGGCSGSPSSTTRQLYGLRHSGKVSQSGTYAQLTRDADSLQPADIHFVALGLRNIANELLSSTEKSSHLDLDDLVSTVNNVLSSQQEDFRSLNTRLNSTNILLESFERLSLDISLNVSDNKDFEISSKSLISVGVVSLTQESSVIGYEDGENNGDNRGRVIREGHNETMEKIMARIILPQNLTKRVTSESTKKVNLIFTTFRSGKLFNEQQSENFNYTLNSYVIQASYEGVEVYDLEVPVKLLFRPLQGINDTVCVFWDFKKNNGIGGWSRNGCSKSKFDYNTGLMTCNCNHLTNFALLINFDSIEFAEAHVLPLEAITIIGGALSIFGLLMVFLTFCLFKKWRRSLTNKILVNLSVAVFFSMVIFLGGIKQTGNHILCRSVAVSLHYFILASFGWMLVEGVHLYYKFVKVLAIYIPGFLRKAAICAWGLPLIPIICLLVYDSSQYESRGQFSVGTRICWISPFGFRYAFLPPLAITMTVNFILYALIIRGAVCKRPKISSSMTSRDLLINQLSMAVCVFFLLGFTWIFGLLAITKARLVFSYLFSIFNTLQGFFIFVFHVCRERSARTQWSVFLSTVTGNSTGLSSYTSAAAHSQSPNMSATSDGNNKTKWNKNTSVSHTPVTFSRAGKVVEETDESQTVGNKITLVSVKNTENEGRLSSIDSAPAVTFENKCKKEE